MHPEAKEALEKIAELADAMGEMARLKQGRPGEGKGTSLFDTAAGEIVAYKTISDTIRSAINSYAA